MIRFGVGTSTLVDVHAAGQDAARTALAQLEGARPDLVLVFSSVRFAQPKMLKGVRSVTGRAPLIGCTNAGGIETAGPRRRSVIVTAIHAPGARIVTGVARGLSQDPESSARGMNEGLIQQRPGDIKAMLVLPDGLARNRERFLKAVQAPWPGSAPLVGGSAADDLYFQQTFQYYGDEVLTDAVPSALLCGDINVGVGVRHGWIAVGSPHKITKASGNVVFEIDGHPAARVYEAYFGRGGVEAGQMPQLGIAYPLGVTIPGAHEALLREPLHLGDNGSLICSADIPQGSQVHVMMGGPEQALQAAKEAATEALEGLGSRPLGGALVFCGVARQRLLGGDYQGEIDVVRDALGGKGVRFSGFSSYGEHAPGQKLKGSRGAANTLHGESIVVVGLA